MRVSVRSPGTGVTDRCELPCGCWGWNPSPLEEQPVLLTAESSLQAQKCFKINVQVSQGAELTILVADISCFAGDNTVWAAGFSPFTGTRSKSYRYRWQWHEGGPSKHTQMRVGWSQCQIKRHGEGLGDDSSGKGICWASLVLWAHVKGETERLSAWSLWPLQALIHVQMNMHTPQQY